MERYDRSMPRHEPPQPARTGLPAGSARRSSRRPPEAPPATREGPPGWLAFIAGAALTVLAYGALRDPDPARARVKTATNAVRPSQREPAEPSEPSIDTAAARRARNPLFSVDAAAPIEDPSDHEDGAEEPPTQVNVPAQPDRD